MNINETPKVMSLAGFFFWRADGLKEQFKAKNKEYGASVDALQNFRRGALLSYGYDGLDDMYACLKDYMNKHIAKLYTHDLDEGVVDSLRDIETYCIIAEYMLYLKRHGRE